MIFLVDGHWRDIYCLGVWFSIISSIAYALPFYSANEKSLKLRTKYLDTLSEGSYVSILFLTVVKELYVDTEWGVDLSALSYQEFELEDAEDDEIKTQTNMAHIFSLALEYAPYLIRLSDFTT
jgi:hypothetical protein